MTPSERLREIAQKLHDIVINKEEHEVPLYRIRTIDKMTEVLISETQRAREESYEKGVRDALEIYENYKRDNYLQPTKSQKILSLLSTKESEKKESK